MTREEFNQMENEHKKYKSLSTEEKENVQIEICKALDNIQKYYCEQPLLAYHNLEYIKEIESDLKKSVFLIRIFERFLK